MFTPFDDKTFDYEFCTQYSKIVQLENSIYWIQCSEITVCIARVQKTYPESFIPLSPCLTVYKTFEYKFCTRIPKSTDLNASHIGYSVLIGLFSSTRRVQNSSKVLRL
jgi:hypothetical protein